MCFQNQDIEEIDWYEKPVKRYLMACLCVASVLLNICAYLLEFKQFLSGLEFCFYYDSFWYVSNRIAAALHFLATW